MFIQTQDTPNPPGTINPIAAIDTAVQRICRFSIRRKRSIDNERTSFKQDMLS